MCSARSGLSGCGRYCRWRVSTTSRGWAFLATDEGLLEGRDVLRSKCVQCHDLRTILARPRTPENWRQTVRRMAQRSTGAEPGQHGRRVGGSGPT